MTDTAEAPEVADEAREALLEAVTSELGDAVVQHHLLPGKDLWIRVANDAFTEVGEYLKDRQRFRYFSYLSAIDWLPSPFGRSHEAMADEADDAGSEEEAEEMVSGYAGGDTRFQILARVYNLTTGLGLNVKADISDDAMSISSWTGIYPGASWHEREAHEMFGIGFSGHPNLDALYLPGDFEGNPLRKDFPLLARLVKPWPGIVDVELMPSDENPEDQAS